MSTTQKMNVSPELLEQTAGFSLDRGSAYLKIVYVPVDSKTGTGIKSKESELSLATFPVAKLDDALNFIYHSCHIKRDSDVLPIYTTGLERQSIKMEESLNISVIIENPTDLEGVIKLLGCFRNVSVPKTQCFAQGLAYLSRNLEPSQYLVRGSGDYGSYVANLRAQMDAFTQTTNSQLRYHSEMLDTLIELTPEETYKKSSLLQPSAGASAFPCLLVVVGSGYTFLKVYGTGQYDVLNLGHTEGESFLGIGSLFSGAETIEGIVNTAIDGDCTQIDMGLFDFKEKVVDTGDMYSSTINAGGDAVNEVIFCFGKTPSKTTGDFKKQDLTKALLQVFAMDLCNQFMNVVTTHGLNDVVLCGSIINSELFQALVRAAFTKKKVDTVTFSSLGADVNLHFMRNASHIAALGAMVSNIMESAQTQSSASPEQQKRS